ncbi:MAG: pilus assembly protein PilM [Chloroflexi bacterium]|nr:pilus assembly protein PilM [Chloroflexota bacterium]
MAINLFKPKDSTDPGKELIRTSSMPLTIPAMLADVRSRYADKVMYRHKVKGKWEQLTSGSAYQQAQDFAAGLVALGHEKGDRVAIICDNGLPWVVAVYGNAMAGGVWVPLYVDLGGEEIEELVKRSGAKATHVAIAISGDAAITKVIQMASNLSERDLEGQVEIQADQYIPFPMEEVSFDWEIVGPNAKDPELIDVLLVATRTTNVEQRQAAVAAAGLQAEIVDVDEDKVRCDFGLQNTDRYEQDCYDAHHSQQAVLACRRTLHFDLRLGVDLDLHGFSFFLCSIRPSFCQM